MNTFIAVLQRERIKCRTTNPIQSEVLGGLLYSAKKTAKDAGREIVDDDIRDAAKKTTKQLSGTLEQLNPVSPLYKRYVKEIEILSEFFPAPPSEEVVKKSINEIIVVLKELGTVDKKSMGTIMKMLKETYPDLDGKEASMWVREALQ